jgi:aerobic carbon-monoxide dehydrogenase medium subunit
MKPAPFHYHAPATLDECLGLLAQYGDDAVLLAGGQSLVPILRFRVVQPAHIIAIRGIAGDLRSIRKSDDGLAIGASVTYIAVQRSPDVLAACPGLPDAIDLVAHPAIRTRGTVCGNLCQADPASELPALALIMDARFRLRSLKGERVVAAADYFVGPYETVRRSDEILVEVVFPRRPAGEKVVVKEVTRLRGGFPMAGVAIALTRGEGTNLRSAAVACFGVHFKQIRVPEAEAALKTKGCTAEGITAAADAIDRAIDPSGDAFASAEYRRSATRSLFRRAIEEACEGA